MGTPQKDSFANKIRTAVKELTANGEECTTAAISVQALLKELRDNKRMLNALRDMVKAGEMVRVRTGVYALAPTALLKGRVEISQVMWRIVRMRGLVTVEDLMEMAGADKDYAREWLSTLVRRGVLSPEGKSYRLLKDTVEMPELTDNADKLRALRAKKKQAVIAALDAANQALGKARNAIDDL